MRIEIINGQRVEFADEGKWLHNNKLDWSRYFTTMVGLSCSDEPWPECTQAEREEWERNHPAPESEPNE